MNGAGKKNLRLQITTNLTDADSHTTTATTKVPQGNCYDFIAEHNIAYFALLPGIKYWGVIQFKVELNGTSIKPNSVTCN